MARTAGDAAGWGLILGLAALAGAQPFLGCTPQDDDPGVDTGAGAAAGPYLAAVGPEVVVPTLAAFRAELVTLDEAVTAWQDAPTDGAVRAAAQDAWFAASEVWQELEVMQVGPAAAALDDPSGEDLRDAVYSWPTVSPCRVDQVTVDGSYEASDFFEESLVNATGLDALEQLLFGAEETACTPQANIVMDGSWDALGAAGRSASRSAYAVVLSDELLTLVDALLDRWTSSFSDALAAEGEAGAYGSRQGALDAVYGALFYVYTETQDLKLALPLGVDGCTGEACLDEVESHIAGGSTRWIAANLRGFRMLFTGGDGAGMDDLLRDLGQGVVAADVLAALDAADAAAAAVDGPIDERAAIDRGTVEALYASVKALGDVVKGDLATVLALQVPTEAAGDND